MPRLLSGATLSDTESVELEECFDDEGASDGMYNGQATNQAELHIK